ncbi:hypothetical protein N7481_010140 [Penicillium waksmanii]|uniref:uncharacterized protein n=1 Tax=Penicillium waksmanii TaxID=69791 RepID=UPI002548144E|nr:uncharacterized protein N7481_010140 [Penicillium waksmanii]KAJ5976433.1 hypothetical protein N7481_010140 [Penicillium waksmanii]
MLRVSFNYIEDYTSLPTGQKGEKRGTQLDTEENLYRHVVVLSSCDRPVCQRGLPARVPILHYILLRPLLLAGSKRLLVTFTEKGSVLESHKDVLDKIQDKLYIEDQQKQEKENRKGGKTFGGKPPYPPININTLLLKNTVCDIALLDGFELEHIYKD